MYEREQITALAQHGSHSQYMIYGISALAPKVPLERNMVRKEKNRELTQTEIRIL
jgi:hypothetical protein